MCFLTWSLVTFCRTRLSVLMMIPESGSGKRRAPCEKKEKNRRLQLALYPSNTACMGGRKTFRGGGGGGGECLPPTFFFFFVWEPLACI